MVKLTTLILISLVAFVCSHNTELKFLENKLRTVTTNPNPIIGFVRGILDGFGVLAELQTPCSMDELFYDEEVNTAANRLEATFFNVTLYNEVGAVEWLDITWKAVRPVMDSFGTVAMEKCQVIDSGIQVFNELFARWASRNFGRDIAANFAVKFDLIKNTALAIATEAATETDKFKLGKEIGALLRIIYIYDY